MSNANLHCDGLIRQFTEYFTKDYAELNYIRNKLLTESQYNTISVAEQEELIALPHDGDLKLEFSHYDLYEFLARRSSEKPVSYNLIS